MESARNPYVLVTGHPYIDIWQAVRPAAVGIAAWPRVPPGLPWKAGVCATLGSATPPTGGAACWARCRRTPTWRRRCWVRSNG